MLLEWVRLSCVRFDIPTEVMRPWDGQIDFMGCG